MIRHNDPVEGAVISIVLLLVMFIAIAAAIYKSNSRYIDPRLPPVIQLIQGSLKANDLESDSPGIKVRIGTGVYNKMQYRYLLEVNGAIALRNGSNMITLTQDEIEFDTSKLFEVCADLKTFLQVSASNPTVDLLGISNLNQE